MKADNNLISKYPMASLGLFCVMFYLFTGGTSSIMGAVRYSLLGVGLTAIALYYLLSVLEKKPLHILWSIPAGIGIGILCNTVTNPLFAVLFYGLGLMILFVVLLAVSKKISWNNMIFPLIFTAVLFRLYWCLISPVSGPGQHDVSYFKFNMDEAAHDNYILWFLKYWKLPDFDVRMNGQFYHPPLHYFICAVVLKINSVIFPGLSENYECLQALTLFYSSATVVIIYKILSCFELKGRSMFFSLFISSLYPGLIILSGSINNDSLAVMFTLLAIYQALRWYKAQTYKNIIFVAIAIGLGMMSKISCGLLAFPIGLMFLIKLIKDSSRAKLIKQYIAFAIVVFPLGMWFPVRNYILHKVPLTYVHNIGLPADQEVSSYGLLARLFDFTGESTQVPFTVYSETIKEFNIFVCLFKTSLFDDFQLTHNSLFLGFGSIIYLVGTIFMVLVLISMVSSVFITFRKKEKTAELTGVVMLLLAEFISIISFAMKYPVICSTSFRYIAPVVACFALFYGITHQAILKSSKFKLLSYVMDGISVLFIILSVLFVSLIWTQI